MRKAHSIEWYRFKIEFYDLEKIRIAEGDSKNVRRGKIPIRIGGKSQFGLDDNYGMIADQYE